VAGWGTGNLFLLAESDENHKRSDEAASAFLSDLRHAISDLNYQLQDRLRGEFVSGEQYSDYRGSP
jgi:hypothetical protein